MRSRKSITSYQHFVIRFLPQELNELAYRLARHLELNGFFAYPIPAMDPSDPLSLSGEISHKHAAPAAGLGDLGWNNLVLTPQSGSRQMFVSVITDAPLEEDPVFTKELCHPED
jgi:epoxyqueuosine reductase QueG